MEEEGYMDWMQKQPDPWGVMMGRSLRFVGGASDGQYVLGRGVSWLFCRQGRARSGGDSAYSAGLRGLGRLWGAGTIIGWTELGTLVLRWWVWKGQGYH